MLKDAVIATPIIFVAMNTRLKDFAEANGSRPILVSELVEVALLKDGATI